MGSVDRSSALRLPESWRLRGELRPALRRGLWVAVPIGAAILLELVGNESPIPGGLATGALLGGFLAFDAPAIVRARWQLLSAPAIGLTAVLGVLSGGSTSLAIVAMAAVASACAFGVAVSVRLQVAGLTCALALVLAQGFEVARDESAVVFAVATGGVLAQAAWSLLAFALGDRGRDPVSLGVAARGARLDLARNLTWSSPALRHALRFGAALALGVAIYRVLGFDRHGYWIPLTILFVLRPSRGETLTRVPMRVAGTIVGLLIATALAEALGSAIVLTAAVLTLAAGCAYALLAIEYAAFTAAITIFVVVLTDRLGEPALRTADERALGTAIGVALAALAFTLWPEPEPRDGAA